MEEKKAIQYKYAKPWRLALWPLANGANNMYIMLMVFVSYVAAGGYGIAVATAGLIATGSRIFDAITDPLCALISDRIPAKYGRVRIILGVGYIIMALSVLFIFHWGVGGNIITYSLGYMVYILGYTLFNIGQNMGNPIITNEPQQRLKCGRWRTIFTQVAAVAVSVYMSNVLAPKYGGLAMGAFQEMCTMCVIVGAIMVVISMVAIAPYDKEENFVSKKSSRVGLKDCVNVLKHNKALWAFIAAASSDKLALQAASQSAITTMVFGIVIGNYKFNGNLNMIALIPSILLAIYASKLKGKGDTKSTLIKWTWVAIVLAVVMVAFMVVGDPTQISVSPIYTLVFLVLYCLYNGAKVVTSMCNGCMVPDVVDYEMYLSGQYMPATVSAVYTFVDKLISSLATTVVGLGVAAVGYVTVMPQPGDACTTPIFWMAMFLWMGLPILGWLCTQVAMKFYPLDKEMMQKVQLANQESRSATADSN